MISSLQPLTLRQNCGLVNEQETYVLVSGELRAQEINFEGSRIVEIGVLIDLKDNLGVKYVACTDCHLLVIRPMSTMPATYRKKLM